MRKSYQEFKQERLLLQKLTLYSRMTVALKICAFDRVSLRSDKPGQQCRLVLVHKAPSWLKKQKMELETRESDCKPELCSEDVGHCKESKM